MKKLTVEAVPENVDAVIDFIGEVLDHSGCGFSDKMAINVAADEIFANIAHYAYSGQTGDVDVSIAVTDEPRTAKIVFSDSGVPFDPLSAAEPDAVQSIDECEIGGMGIHIVKKTMDAVDYRYADGRNILTIAKRF